MEKALQAAEKALADQEKKSDPKSLDACMAALADVNSVADKTIKKELDKKKHKDCIAVLEKYDGLIKAVRFRDAALPCLGTIAPIQVDLAA